MNSKPGQDALPTEVGEREAFHLHAIVVICNVTLIPGQDLKFSKSIKETEPANTDKRDGVADPFLKHGILPNTPFLFFLDQDKIENFKHNFSIKSDLDKEEKREVYKGKTAKALDKALEAEKEFAAVQNEDFWECRNCYN